MKQNIVKKTLFLGLEFYRGVVPIESNYILILRVFNIYFRDTFATN